MTNTVIFQTVDASLQLREAELGAVEVTITNTLNNNTRISTRFFVINREIERLKTFVKELE